MGPLQALEQISSEYRGVWKSVEEAAISNLTEQKWGLDILLPYAEWLPLLLDVSSPGWQRNLQKGDMMPINGIDFVTVCSIGTWRYTKGIYRVNNEIAKELLNSEFNVKIPANLLLKQPEWSIYIDIENFNITIKQKKVIGFWSNINCLHTDISTFSKNKILMITPLFEDGVGYMLSVSILLDEGKNFTIEESTEYMPKKLTSKIAIGTRSEDDISEINSFKKKIVQILLYICQPEPDVCVDGKDVELVNRNPSPKKIKNVKRLFEAKKVKYFEFGDKTSNHIKQAMAIYKNIGKRKEPHIRSAHWHGYWKGSKKDRNQEFFYKWIPPVIVNSEICDEDLIN